jgi:hypothetical protein
MPSSLTHLTLNLIHNFFSTFRLPLHVRAYILPFSHDTSNTFHSFFFKCSYFIIFTSLSSTVQTFFLTTFLSSPFYSTFILLFLIIPLCLLQSCLLLLRLIHASSFHLSFIHLLGSCMSPSNPRFCPTFDPKIKLNLHYASPSVWRVNL